MNRHINPLFSAGDVTIHSTKTASNYMKTIMEVLRGVIAKLLQAFAYTLLVSQLHNSKISESDLLQQYRNDRSHRWIGIPESVGDHKIKPELLLYSALAGQFTNADIAKPLLRLPRKQCPRLVSFIGDIGVGKSTIVKNLIRLVPISPDSGALETSPVPVVGTTSRSEHSTSEGIHLYTDPTTFVTQRPIVYAGMCCA
jgi:hypothetical protein